MTRKTLLSTIAILCTGIAVNAFAQCGTSSTSNSGSKGSFSYASYSNASNSCSSQPTHTSTRTTQDIVGIAASAGSFSTLISAVEAAGLVEVLQGEGPFTVFAPTDEAFAKLPAGTLASLLKPENRAQLQSILTYHVVPGKTVAADVIKNHTATTVQGQNLKVSTASGRVLINDAVVTQADVMASNGVIHVIDRVVLPRM